MTPGASLSDLLTATAGRDRAAFRALYEATAARFKTVALLMVGNEEEAEQALLEAYEKVWQESSGFQPEHDSAVAWILTQVRAAALRRPRGTGLPTADRLPAAGEAPVWRDLAGLADGERHALLRTYRNGWSYSRLAQEGGIAPSAARETLLRALRSLGAATEGELLAAEAVVGTLDPASQEEVERRCRTDLHMATAWRTWSARLAPVAMAAGETAPSSGLWPRIAAVTGALGAIPVPKTVLQMGRLPIIRRDRRERRLRVLTVIGIGLAAALATFVATGSTLPP